MNKIKIKEKFQSALPANQMFWNAYDSDETIISPNRLFSVSKYNTVSCPASRFYKPISRVFPIGNLFEK